MDLHVCCVSTIWQHNTFGTVPSHDELIIAKREGYGKLVQELTTRLKGSEGSKRVMKINISVPERKLDEFNIITTEMEQPNLINLVMIPMADNPI